jgi:hypothetical protein
MKSLSLATILITATGSIVLSFALPIHYDPENSRQPPYSIQLDQRSFVSAYQDHMDKADPLTVLGETEQEALAAGVCCESTK